MGVAVWMRGQPMVSGSAIGVDEALMAQIVEDRDPGPAFSARLLPAEVTPQALLTQYLILRQIEEGASPLGIEEPGLTLIADAFCDPRAQNRTARFRFAAQFPDRHVNKPVQAIQSAISW